MAIRRWQRWLMAASWVTNTKVVSVAWFRSIINAMTRSPLALSKLPVGSSASNTAG